jgi:hypothetical protein
VDRRAQLFETTLRLVAEHGPAAGAVAHRRARARLASGNEFEAAMWLEIVRLVGCLTGPAGANVTWAETLPPAPDEVYGRVARPDFRHPTRPANVTAIELTPIERSGRPAAAIAASDRSRGRPLGSLALFGALLGAAAVAAISFSAPQRAVAPQSEVAPQGEIAPQGEVAPQSAMVPSTAVAPVAPPIVAVAEPQPDASLLVMIKAADAAEPKPQAAPRAIKRTATHKPPAKRVAASRRHREKSFWDRIATVFR